MLIDGPSALIENRLIAIYRALTGSKAVLAAVFRFRQPNEGSSKIMNLYWPIALIVLSNVFYYVCSKSTPADINPFASLTVTYIVGALASAILYFALNRSGSLLREYHHLNWSSVVLGLTIVGLEAGSVYMYKAGWNISTGQIVYSSILAVILIAVGYFFYHEQITASKIAGILICLVGLYFINK